MTVLQADAADEKAISGVCKQAMQEEGRLDVFFANVSLPSEEPILQVEVHDETTRPLLPQRPYWRTQT